jgi:uncharacterized membrane protein
MKMYSEYRAQARETLKGRWNEMALVTLIVFAIGMVCSSPAMLTSGLEDKLYSIFGSCTQLVLSLLIAVPLQFAFYNLLLRYARSEELEGSYISFCFKDFAANWSKYFVAGLLMTLVLVVVLVPTLMIGTIILGLAYTIVPFVIRDNPELSAREALRKSRLMMRGHKWEMFVLQLTFIGWALLCIFTCFIGFLWLEPYITTSLAHFYEDVKAEYEAVEAAVEA